MVVSSRSSLDGYVCFGTVGGRGGGIYMGQGVNALGRYLQRGEERRGGLQVMIMLLLVEQSSDATVGGLAT
jgi:hypothetical protein